MIDGLRSEERRGAFFIETSARSLARPPSLTAEEAVLREEIGEK